MPDHNKTVFPAEWACQDAVMLTWPHKDTDWAPVLEEVTATYREIATAVVKHQRLIVVCREVKSVASLFPKEQLDRIIFCPLPSNDTWARDHGPVCTFEEAYPVVNDFGFNGWGNKFYAGLDDLIPSGLFESGIFRESVRYVNRREFILEGGSIETDGDGTILTTSACLLHPSRNPGLTKPEIEERIARALGAGRILWLDHGHLEGDDTDSHIDTLARFCNEHTIAYVQCTDPSDSHYPGLSAMEEQLKSFTRADGRPYHLVPLPMVSPLSGSDGKRLGATYANFLIINDAVLVPVYGTPEDEAAVDRLRSVFPEREIVPVNCLSLIKQNGSLHCITMQIPKGFLP